MNFTVQRWPTVDAVCWFQSLARTKNIIRNSHLFRRSNDVDRSQCGDSGLVFVLQNLITFRILVGCKSMKYIYEENCENRMKDAESQHSMCKERFRHLTYTINVRKTNYCFSKRLRSLFASCIIFSQLKMWVSYWLFNNVLILWSCSKNATGDFNKLIS